MPTYKRPDVPAAMSGRFLLASVRFLASFVLVSQQTTFLKKVLGRLETNGVSEKGTESASTRGRF
ncbi:hypothetical protein [Olsenella uli]|uniref:hypothetical protein n=1 Tax=Olsenella uli TaxID=133926 RepID=UPI0012AC48C9|nr:hypothetical protein [Olsenella uli]